MRLLAWHALRGKLGVPPGLMALRNGEHPFSGGSILDRLATGLGPRGGLGPCTYATKVRLAAAFVFVLVGGISWRLYFRFPQKQAAKNPPPTPFFKRESVASGSLSGFMERSTATTQSGFVSKADTKPLVTPAADLSIRGQATTGIHNDLKRQMIKVEKAASLHRVVNVSAFATNFISMEQREYFLRSLPSTPIPARSRTGVDCGSVERMKQVTQ